MAAAKATKLTRLDTRGVAIVDKGANGKRIALAKAADAGATFEQLLLELISKGDMPLDDKAVEDMAMRAGLDAQAIETFKAILKLAHVYGDNAAFNGLLKQQFAAMGKPEDPAAAQPQPGAPGQSPMPGKPPMPGAPQAGQPAAPPPMGQKPAGDEQEQAPGEQQADAAGSEPGEGTDQEESGDEPGDQQPQGDGGAAPPKKKKPPFFKAATANDAEGDDAMTEKEIQEAIAKATTAAVADLKKSNDDLVAVNKAQQTALDAQATAVKKMQDDARLAGWVAKADRDLKAIPGETAETLGKQLFDLDSIKPEMAVAAFETFKKTAAVVTASGLFTSPGYGNAAPIAAAGSAEAEIERLVGEIVAKGTSTEPADIARARAIVAVSKAHPALYKRYCDEQEHNASKRS